MIGKIVVFVNTSVQTIFITGTGTGVGKTLLTGLLLHHLRQSGVHAFAMKPFCSGGTMDVDLLYGLQDGELSRPEINPFYFREPIAPLLACRIRRRRIRLADVIKKIEHVRRLLQPSQLVTQKSCARGSVATHPSTLDTRHPSLLLEGSGGLLVPLGEGYAVLDLISKSNAEVVVVSQNALGTINHTLLTVRTLQTAVKKRTSVVLMDQQAPDLASKTNAYILSELLAPIPLFHLPYLGPNLVRRDRIKTAASKVAATLSKIVKFHLPNRMPFVTVGADSRYDHNRAG
jgi:dethiobiotin synthetase